MKIANCFGAEPVSIRLGLASLPRAAWPRATAWAIRTGLTTRENRSLSVDSPPAIESRLRYHSFEEYNIQTALQILACSFLRSTAHNNRIRIPSAFSYPDSRQRRRGRPSTDLPAPHLRSSCPCSLCCRASLPPEISAKPVRPRQNLLLLY